MGVQLKPLSEQVIVISGASSGIGLTTARMAAERGARLVLAARNEAALNDIAHQMRAGGVEVEVVAADVGREEDVRRIAEAAIRRFGGFDTWFNNAGISVFGPLARTPLEDHRRLFDTTYWGVVHGSLVAVEHLGTGRDGGALINMGSVASDLAIPYQGAYSAAKHAVKGFTDALRMELEADGAPISVTLIKPTSIDTPFAEHARNYLPSEPRLPPPVYAPDLVARAVLHAAEHPVRDLYIGSSAKAMAASGRWMPRLTDYAMERTMYGAQQTGQPGGHPGDSLYAPHDGGRERSRQGYFTRERSLYTAAELHPAATTTAVAALALGAVAAGAALLGQGTSRWRETSSSSRPYPRRWNG